MAERVGTVECSFMLDLKTSVSLTGLIAVNSILDWEDAFYSLSGKVVISILDLKNARGYFCPMAVNSILDLKG